MEAPAHNAFLRRLEDALLQQVDKTVVNAVARVTLYLPAPDIFAWLAAQPFGQKLFWASRNRTTCIAGIGVADAFIPHSKSLQKHFSDIQQKLASTPDARYFGGIRFAPHQAPSAEWLPFGTSSFFLPRFELHVETGRRTDAKFICNFVGGKESIATILEEARKICFDFLPLPKHLENPLFKQNFPNAEKWHQNVGFLLAQFKSGFLQKTVLARKTLLQFADELNPFQILKNLYYTKPSCYHFLFQPESGCAFLGATPERLYKRNQRALYTEAVAGTRPRGTTPTDDQALQDDLLYSEKDRREQAFVSDFITRALSPNCESVQMQKEPNVMVLSRRMHLHTRIRAEVRPEVSDADLIHALHPTPAVCGEPRATTLSVLPTLEPFDRGWYAGPVGWISGEAAEFAVAIRSGLCRGRALSLFAGAGIVQGSVAENEWTEIEGKISDFLEEVQAETVVSV